jgi:hypothetical protein
MNILLFGSNNPSGAAFLKLCPRESLEIWGRKAPIGMSNIHIYCDLSLMPDTPISPLRGILVSFAPIWILASYLTHLLEHQPDSVAGLKGIIACSSSSFLTKRFACNTDDKRLAYSLGNAHSLIHAFSSHLTIPSIILAPTMIYGQVDNYGDKNLKRIVSIMRQSPFILLPKTAGLRQPIHATQLALVAHRQAKLISGGQQSGNLHDVVLLGGDTTLSYQEMLLSLQKELGSTDRARHCRILSIPDQLFLLLVAPILPFRPRLFEAIMRIKSNLSGFEEVHQLLEEPAKSFPVLPLAK